MHVARKHAQPTLKFIQQGGGLPTWKHLDYSDPLLTKEISDLNVGAIICDVGVDGEMGIYKPHLVLKAFGHTLDHVLQASMILLRVCSVLQFLVKAF